MSNKPNSKSKFTHPLHGSSLGNLIRLLRINGLPAGGKRGQFLSALASAVARSPVSLFEQLRYQRSLRVLSIPPPIFIIGHWRSGTTHLANLLSQSPHFGTVTPVASGLPHNLLTIGKWLRPLLEKKIPADRLIDQVAITAGSPQEDEFGIANMVTTSWLHGLYFPGNFDGNWKTGVFHKDWSDIQMQQWKTAHVNYLKKVYVDQGSRPLIVRNPAYTTRVPILRSIWPEARFIHIYRNPYEVFSSMQNYFRKLLPVLALQDYSKVDIDQVIFSTFRELMQSAMVQLPKLPAHEFIEVSYEELRQAPVSTVQKIYARLQIPDFEATEPRFKNYLNGIRSYQKNKYEQNQTERELISNNWGHIIDHYGYRGNS